MWDRLYEEGNLVGLPVLAYASGFQSLAYASGWQPWWFFEVVFD
jgi:hypothetical protein